MKQTWILNLFLAVSCTSLWANEITQADIGRARKEHWAFTLKHDVAVPDIKSTWPKNEVDKFILQKLQENKLEPSAEASKAELIRRAYMALTGLPPSFEEVEAFVANTAIDAYEKLIDRLLQSPRYGEQWGRNWLDVARYADSKGFSAPGESDVIPYAWTYRDYVIRSFNEDRPFNEFVKQQLAADLMDLKDKRDLAALGFIRLGRDYRDMKERPHEMVDVTTQAFLGLTVACARCHDHKFDPIPTADYYSLYGVFRSLNEPKDEDLPQIYESSDLAEKEAYQELYDRAQ